MWKYISWVGNDKFKGFAGNDIFIDGLGTDILTGGTGIDTFDFNAAMLAGQPQGIAPTEHGHRYIKGLPP